MPKNAIVTYMAKMNLPPDVVETIEAGMTTEPSLEQAIKKAVQDDPVNYFEYITDESVEDVSY